LPRVNINDIYRRRVKDLLGNTDIDKIVVDLNKQWTPEKWFQQIKRRWYFHELSWYLFEETERYTKQCSHPMAEMSFIDNPYFCNAITGCIEGCPYREEKGRLEYSTIQKAVSGFNHYPHLLEAHGELEEELKKLQADLERSKREIPLEVRQQREQAATNKPQILKLLEAKPFWIRNHRHLHLQQFLMTQGKCCFNHIIDEPEKYGSPIPIWD
jgi:hypothetical protein